MQQRHLFTWLAVSLAMCAAPERAGAIETGAVRVKLTEQIRRADHAAHVVILGVESLQHVAGGVANAADFEGNPTVEEVDALSTKPGTVACQRARGDLYLTDTAENIFLIDSTSGSTAWFQFSSDETILSPDMGTPKLGRCEPLPEGGCIQKDSDRIEWERLGEALRSGTKLNK